MLIAHANGRKIPKEDKIFSLNGRAKAMIRKEGNDSVANAAIGALLDDDGNLMVLSSVAETIGKLSVTDYAEYAPIGGIPEFRDAVRKAVFKNYVPDAFTEVCATVGGTGAIRNTISNYSEAGDSVLTTDWFWGPYNIISQETGRKLVTYEMFDRNRNYNFEALEKKAKELAEAQGSLILILNTPAHNPTGYSLSDSDWDRLTEILDDIAAGDKKITLFIDAAYIDFAGDEEEARSFLPKLEKFSDNVLPVIGYSASKTLTMYGMRCGAMICIAKTPEIASEFRMVSEFSSRGSWSNGVHAAQALFADIFADSSLMKKVEQERDGLRNMLAKRGRIFTDALKSHGIEPVPFDAGFFSCVECTDSDRISRQLEKKGVFAVPLAKGLRVSVASISEKKCRRSAEVLAEVLKENADPA